MIPARRARLAAHMVLHSKVTALMHMVRLRAAGRVHQGMKFCTGTNFHWTSLHCRGQQVPGCQQLWALRLRGLGDERAAAVCRYAVGLVDAC